VLFFTHAITYTGAWWEEELFDWVAIFNCYNVVGDVWEALVAHMLFKGRTLFRAVYCQDNVSSPDDV